MLSGYFYKSLPFFLFSCAIINNMFTTVLFLSWMIFLFSVFTLWSMYVGMCNKSSRSVIRDFHFLCRQNSFENFLFLVTPALVAVVSFDLGLLTCRYLWHKKNRSSCDIDLPHVECEHDSREAQYISLHARIPALVWYSDNQRRHLVTINISIVLMALTVPKI